MPLSIGDKLGPYEILTPIGTGGMGEVYRALDVLQVASSMDDIAAAILGVRWHTLAPSPLIAERATISVAAMFRHALL